MTGKFDVRVVYEVLDKQGNVKTGGRVFHNDVDGASIPRHDYAAGLAMDAYGQALAGDPGKATSPAKAKSR